LPEFRAPWGFVHVSLTAEPRASDPFAPVLSFADIEQARVRISGSIYVSPCAYSETLSKRTGTKCWLKLENLQMTGSFKERGACNKLITLTDDEKKHGVVCASAGNHAQGVAYHSTRLGIDAAIVMPETSPLNKVQNTREFLTRGGPGMAPGQGLSGRIVLHGTNLDDGFVEAQRIQQAEGRLFVHPFDDHLIMAGQGTIGLELLEQNPYLEAVVVAVGGGGLISGIAVAIKETNPRIKVYGVETTAIDSMKKAIAQGQPVTLPPAHTIAEGIAVRRAGEKTLEVVRKYVDDIVLVDEEEIAEAILMLLEKEKTVAEGAGAAPLAALIQKRLPVIGKKVAVIVSGGNIDVNVISRIIERGLAKSGRMVRLQVKISDATGSLAQLTALVARSGGNIVQIHHDRTFSEMGLGETVVEMVLETRGFDHVEELRGALAKSGYRVTEAR
jgi:threonine dehydratase